MIQVIAVIVAICVVMFGIELYDLTKSANTYLKVLTEKEEPKRPQYTTRQ